MEQIIPYLYVGNQYEVMSAIYDYNANAVFDLRPDDEQKLYYNYSEEDLCDELNVVYWNNISFPDGISVDIENLNSLVKLINIYINAEKPIFIHCNAEISRTALVVCCYLIAYCNMSPLEAIRYSKSKRDCFIIHKNLLKSLFEFGKQYYYEILDWEEIYEEGKELERINKDC
jgi:protein-tyrosine phosphatase